ncbi:MAG: transposase [Candidatus Thermoplasmatota archaeon]|uniref:transposase n=1 Tax=Ferroplasma sp. TaxID=2591003 RepID=UPI0026242455|nr:transposase [Ferroplasma sp.]MCL4312160.1 transposase [Candidatus Thermoplasmatota archaeon]
MSGKVYTADEKYNIIMESFQNPNIAIASICREHGIAVSMFYKWKEQFLDKWDNDNGFREYYGEFLKNMKDSYTRGRNNYYGNMRINVP